MVDFLMISTKCTKRGTIEVSPKFRIGKSNDLMIRGGDFYAIWVEEAGMWSQNREDAVRLIDKELDKYVNAHRNEFDGNYKVNYMWDSDSGSIDAWNKYCKQQMWDSYKPLDEKLIFVNSPINKEDYASKRLPYALEEGDYSAWDKLISTLYSPEERRKIEWAIGAIVSGDSKHIQKFMVFYGDPGTGKSTIINVIQKLFVGYYAAFDAKSLGSSSNQFALESFKSNPLVAIQHDGDLSRIEDNTRLNSLVSHESMTVNEKFKSSYESRFNSFLIMGTNKPVKISDAKSGIIRRLIDVTPSGNKLPEREYREVVSAINFELGAIAKHCLDVYEEDPDYYNNYVATGMLGASNDFYNYIMDNFLVFKKEDGISLKQAWDMYKLYCEDAKVPYPLNLRLFKEELKNYFREFKERHRTDDDVRIRNYYSGFLYEKFENTEDVKVIETKPKNWIELKQQPSILDKDYRDVPAQYATSTEHPTTAWNNVKTKLCDIDTTKLHYVKVPSNLIVIDFDIPDENGNKCLEKNLEAASKWPPTYVETSKSGNGLHLHYVYNGDISKLKRDYAPHIEVKLWVGNATLRRKLVLCNDLKIATISSGLPFKEEEVLVNFDTVKSEMGLRKMIIRNLQKEIHASTKPSVDFIKKILDDAYNSGLSYDVSDMKSDIIAFAMQSTNQSDTCLKTVMTMHFTSDDVQEQQRQEYDEQYNKIVFFDIECFKNLLLICYKIAEENPNLQDFIDGSIKEKGNKVVRLYNPKPSQVEELMKYKLVGYNNRGYDNHIIYACYMGYNNMDMYNVSKSIISNKPNAKFSQAYNLSYTDVYDYLSAGNKKSLKKWEIELGMKHHELGLDWDEPVPEELWPIVGDYCDDDVYATEAVHIKNKSDFTARLILADMANGTPNDTTNTLTTKFIFGNNRTPQKDFNYRDMSKPVYELEPATEEFLKSKCPEMMSVRHGAAKSLLPYFEGYTFKNGVSTYRDINEHNPNPLYQKVGEGGFVEADFGIHANVALLDITSQHPHSGIAECVFGPDYTQRFYDIVYSRVHIKHEEWHEVNNMLDGVLSPYVEKVKRGEMKSKDLANALKTAINSVYGLTSAGFENPFKDPRNVDNIIAKRGALFMIDLKHAVREKGYKVVHIKTDSIKIAQADSEIIEFVMEFGKKYGYNFEHEATYDRMCLVNKAVYIAKYATSEKCEKLYGYVPGDNREHGGQWTATGTQFQVPYVFKTLFSHEELEFKDYCSTFQVSTTEYIDMNEGLPDTTKEEAMMKKLRTEYKNLLKSCQLLHVGKGSKESIDEAYKFEMNDVLHKFKKVKEEYNKGHKYVFVGKIGEFVPVVKGGGILVRQTEDIDGSKKFDAVTGTKGYRWLESDVVKSQGLYDNIDTSYWNELCREAVKSIEEYTRQQEKTFDDFVSEEEYEVLPFI